MTDLTELTVDLDQAITMVGKKTADDELRAFGAVVAAALLLHRITGKADEEILTLIESLLDDARDALHAVWKRQ